jgi:hypothetical protein
MQIDLRRLSKIPPARARAGVRREAWSINFGVASLFDREYYEHLSYQRDPFRSGLRVPEPGRNLFLNVSLPVLAASFDGKARGPYPRVRAFPNAPIPLALFR